MEPLIDFLSALEPEFETHEFYWSGIHPDKDHQPARIQAYGTIEEMLPALIRRNEEGFGIYICLNRLTKVVDEHGVARRKATQVNKVRAVFADWDDASRPPPDVPLEPSIIVQTSGHKCHLYWLVDDFPLADFERVQRGIAQLLGSDPSVIDLSREMRVPGLMHTKGKPQEVRMLLYKPHRRYTAGQVLKAFPHKEIVPKFAVPWEGDVRVKPALTAAIVNWFYGPTTRPDGGYNVPCPWEGEHTTPSSATSTTYWPPGELNGGLGSFVCKHAHCVDRMSGAYDDWIVERLGQVLPERRK